MAMLKLKLNSAIQFMQAAALFISSLPQFGAFHPAAPGIPWYFAVSNDWQTRNHNVYPVAG
jgi:hypothetical protein